MFSCASGARGRSGATKRIQAHSVAQPMFVADAFLPSPARSLSNLFNSIPRSGIEPAPTTLLTGEGV